MLHIGILSLPSNFHCQKWAYALQATGARVSVYSLEQHSLPGLRTVYIPPPVNWGGRYRFASYKRTAKQLRQALDEDGVDVVNALHLTPFGWWGLQAGHRPLVASALGADVLEYLPGAPSIGYNRTKPGGWIQRRKRAYFRKIVQKVVSQADLVTADNKYLCNMLQQHFGVEGPRLLPWGVSDAILSPDLSGKQLLMDKLGIAEGQRVVLAPRGANAFYQADVILEAFTRLNKKHSQKLVLLSAGYPVSEEVSQQAKRLMANNLDFIFYEGQLSAAEMGILWSLTDVFVSAPLYDGYSATLAEGRATGAIPIVNDLPAYREELTHNETGLFVSPFTAENLAECLASTLKNLSRFQDTIVQNNHSWAKAHADIHPIALQFVEWCGNFKECKP